MIEQVPHYPATGFLMSSQREQPLGTLSRVWAVPPEDLCLRKSELHVWYTSLELEARQVGVLWNTLSSDEKTRAQRFFSKNDRNSFVVARGLLRTILGRYLRRQPATFTFSYNQYGKPQLPPAERQESIYFNLSHSGTRALFAFTLMGSVGIDIEYMRAHDLEAIARRFFSKDEQTALEKTSAEFKPDAFYTCWVRKEAFIKAHGKGLSLALDSFDVLSTAGQARWCNGNEPVDREIRWSIIDLPVDAGYRGALVAQATQSIRCFCAR